MKPEGLSQDLEAIGEKARARLAKKDAARERALPLCREVIRHSALAIRHVHRGEVPQAEALLSQTEGLLRDIDQLLASHGDIRHAGFVDSAQKEYAEGRAFLALIARRPLPDAEGLGIGVAPYLNGLGEATGELRRYILDSIRRGDLSRGDELLEAMDEIYVLLGSMDFPDALTGGLRRTTDQVRGALERTRGDLTLALRQEALERRLKAHGS